MRSLRIVSVLGLSLALTIVSFGCGSDKDDKGTSPKVEQMTDEQAAVQAASSLESGLGVVLEAISSARSDWDGYEPPDIEGTIEGFGKITMPTDTVWGDTSAAGWLIFYADASYSGTSNGTTISGDFLFSDSVMLRVGESPEPLTTDPDYLDARARGEFDLSLSNDEGSVALMLTFTQSVLFTEQTVSTVAASLDERFTLELVGDLPPAKMRTDANESINVQYSYDVLVDNLIFSAEDDYTCPVSGAISIDIDALARDASTTYQGSATAILTIAGDGVVTGTVSSGNYTLDFTYDQFCADPEATSMLPTSLLKMF